MSKPDGGPAFPRPIGHSGATSVLDREVNCEQQGMSLRDYFAGQALAVVAQYRSIRKSTDYLDETVGVAKSVAAWAYEIADAMLAARETT